MVTLILNEETVISLASKPNWVIATIKTINDRKYEVRKIDTINDITTIYLSDSGIEQ